MQMEALNPIIADILLDDAAMFYDSAMQCEGDLNFLISLISEGIYRLAAEVGVEDVRNTINLIIDEISFEEES